MAPRRPKFEYSMICDDIREEKGNKLTLVGVYPHNILVPNFPFTFAKLCFLFSYKGVKSGDTFLMQLTGPSGKEIGPAIKGHVGQAIKRSSRFMALAILSPLVADEEGLYNMLVTFNDDDNNKQEISFNINQQDNT